MPAIEQATQSLYGSIFQQLTDDEFNRSADLFAYRLEASGFDLERFKGKTCLDAGCGGGRYTVALCNLGAERVFGLDFTPSNIKETAKWVEKFDYSDKVDLREGDITQLPYEDETFDIVVCNGVLHHIDNHNKAIYECVRCLKTGGQFIIFMHGAYGVHWHLWEFARKIIHAHVPYEFSYRMLKTLGFDEGKVWHYLDTWYVPVQKKMVAGELEDVFVKLGMSVDLRLASGITRDTNSLAQQYPEFYGEGDHRYVFEKKNGPTAIPDLPSHHEEQISKDPIYGKLDACFEDIQSKLDKCQDPYVPFIVSLVLSKGITDMMEAGDFDGDQILEEVQWVQSTLV